jgi:FAD/FMN-containing dehydrogenase
MVDFESLSCEGLTVITPDQDSFLETIKSKAFNGRIQQDLLPDAILSAETVEAVVAAVKFCSKNAGLRCTIRCGGHSWQNAWLRGKGTVMIDVGSLNDITFDAENGTVTAGVGATGTAINAALPDHLFFQTGHCINVPIGGYTLGGGFSLGFTKFGMASYSVESMEVVLANGETKTVVVDESANDSVDQAIVKLFRGSYCLFPAIVTRYTFKVRPKPVCLTSMFVFRMEEWEKVLTMARDIQHRGKPDAAAVETTMVMTWTPPPLAEATGEAKMAGLSLLVWADSEENARTLYGKYSKHVTGTLVPPEEPSLLPAKNVPSEIFAPFYPQKARYISEGHVGDEQLWGLSDEELASFTKPVADMWMGEEVPPPPSHTIWVPIHPSIKERHGNKTLATGVHPSLVFLSYAIFTDESQDDLWATKLAEAHKKVHEHKAMWKEIPEGNIRANGKEQDGFRPDALEAVKQSISVLDPKGLFYREI